MAKIRNLKKNLRYWEDFFVANAYFTTLVTKDENEAEEVYKLTEEMQNKINEVRNIIINPSHRYKRLPKATAKVERKKLKHQHAKQINEAVDNFLKLYNEHFDKVDQILLDNLPK
ncbi:MAG: hypothetical protein PWQ14_1389 [Rikenellaceae bacterium]|nr:hypothetical protein [Rikenellaceae bacterium]